MKDAPSELIAFDHRLDEFRKRGVEVIGCSIDSEFTHLAWKNTPVNNGDIDGMLRAAERGATSRRYVLVPSGPFPIRGITV